MNKNVLIIGFGVSGRAVAKFLDNKDILYTVYDKNEKFNTFDGDFRGISFAILSPGIPYNSEIILMANKYNIEIISELEYGLSFMNTNTIAITGTNGKTTTILLVEHILKECGIHAIAMGNIGIPVTEFATKMSRKDYAVIEVSSFQLQSLKSAKFGTIAITNIAFDHLSEHKNYPDYINAKLHLIDLVEEGGKIVLNYDDNILRERIVSEQNLSFYSIKNRVAGAYFKGDRIFYKGQYICDLDDMPVASKHNISNVLCAISICMPLDIAPNSFRKALLTFCMPPYRIQDMGYHKDKHYFNDSKATNISATLCACNSMIGYTGLILGGSDKGEEYTELFSKLPPTIKYVAVSGDNANKIILGAKKSEYDSIQVFPTIDECIEYCRKLDVKNILFSPASASYDRFSGYVERGEYFNNLIC